MPLLQKLPGRHPARRVGSDVSVVGTLGMFPVAATSWELLCPKPHNPMGSWSFLLQEAGCFHSTK